MGRYRRKCQSCLIAVRDSLHIIHTKCLSSSHKRSHRKECDDAPLCLSALPHPPLHPSFITWCNALA